MIDVILLMIAFAGMIARLLDSGDEGQNVVDKPGERIFDR